MMLLHWRQKEVPKRSNTSGFHFECTECLKQAGNHNLVYVILQAIRRKEIVIEYKREEAHLMSQLEWAVEQLPNQ